MTAYLKAAVGALIAGLGSLYQALDNGGVSAQEWTAVAIATLAALGIVWGVPNLDPAAQHQAESVQPPKRATKRTQRGESYLGLVVAVLVVVILVVVLLRVL